MPKISGRRVSKFLMGAAGSLTDVSTVAESTPTGMDEIKDGIREFEWSASRAQLPTTSLEDEYNTYEPGIGEAEFSCVGYWDDGGGGLPNEIFASNGDLISTPLAIYIEFGGIAGNEKQLQFIGAPSEYSSGRDADGNSVLNVSFTNYGDEGVLVKDH